MNTSFQPDSTHRYTQPRLAKQAILVLEFSQAPVSSFLIKQANPSAWELTKGFTFPLIGAQLDQLPEPLNAPELLEQLHEVRNHGTTTQFQLRPPNPLTESVRVYDCQLLKVDHQVLVLSLEPVEQGPDGESSLEQVLETMPTGLILFRTLRNAEQEIIDFQAILCNQVGADITRQSRRDILTRPISERYPGMDAYELFQRYIAVVTTGKSHHQLLYLPPQDIWLDVFVVKYGDGLLVSFQDVTLGQKTASLLESVMNSSPAAVRYYESIRDPMGVIIDFMTSTGNELAAYRPFRPAQSTTGQRMLELYPYLKINGLFDRYVVVVESGESDRFETSHQLDTHTVWFDCTAVRHGDGFVLTTLDITPVKQAQLEGQRQTELIGGVLNSSASSILVLEPLRDEIGQINDFRINLANPATMRLFSQFVGRNFTQEDVMANTLLTLFPAGKERAIFTALITVVSTGKPIHQPVDYPGLGIAYDYDITPFRDGVLMITTDITPLRSYQQKLEVNNAALSRSNEYLQQFAYVASHDLQEPLRKIHAFNDILLTRYVDALDNTGQDLLRRQQQAALRMQTLIKDLLDYSRLTSRPVPFQPVSLKSLTEGVLSDLETTIRETNARVTVDELPTLPGDATQLRQLMQNLLANALKFAKAGEPPQVYLSANSLAAEQLPPPYTGQGQWVALTVADNGIGFDESHGERIFELFHRLHGRSQYLGTGIGLAVVKKVVENHGGFVTAHSKPGAGATFTVYLPQVLS
ncbi:MAG: sensor signal transduction histidine kinase [Spirosoma sp.]|nr:sensor signal transduction histidine kinase [Spirosoma sp.]